ncbi:MAG: tRNA (adenosine(37)-N6)-threonylcarbamoyltransferase complex ATPase subunit type 1 TsaE [Peptoniphilus sp.]|nr:tRNA (adenosine(37)-N6)-threonylcarbamoyltransferase complex ATPase subunit type 1 TsaE [Peptoniphilus sp.]MDD7363174.1 tRNA (adenosine(37)-N6)-threonylcarbamoyltransferase complex ATPase subunit type 1 TsaE [Bacillota bacterium]MDY6044502.1 tRNA (adenosine(37)-N6)-threonylcarbamoyltransferase complex ATPase subunit type 1 TsaE [Peptoniphilus sp.]
MRLNGVEDTRAFGRFLGEKMEPYDVLALIGDLGTGKTTFVKALAEGMGLSSDVTSATFTIVNIYQGELPLYHFDVYRLKDDMEFFEMGGEDLMDDGAVCAIEWADRIEASLPEDYLALYFKRIDETTRSVRIEGFGARGKELEREVMRYENSRL